MSQTTQVPTLGENKMGTMPLGKLLTNMAVPLAAAMLVQALYNIVDSIYISRISESAVTALSLAFPVQNLQIGFATGIGVGVNSMVSKSLGQGNQEQANRTAGNGIVLMLIAVGLFMLFGIFGSHAYYDIQSDVEETVSGGTIYTMICCVGTLGIFVEVLGERLLQSSGRAVYSMITQTVGAVINILLDPVLIFGYFGLPAMGIAGAALATVIGQWVAAGLAVFFNIRYNPEVQFGKKYLGLQKDAALPILTVGIPSIVMMGIGSVLNFGMNWILQGFNETATGVFGIYYKLQSFFFMPIMGLNNASISILAYNYGAGRPDRITGTLKRSCVAAFCIMMLGLAAFQLIPDVLLGIFKPSEEFLRIGRSALGIISFHFPIAAFCIALGASFQALGNGLYSTITSLCRQLIVLLPVAYLLSLTGEVTAVWWAFPIAEVVSLIATLIFFIRIYRKKIKPMMR